MNSRLSVKKNEGLLLFEGTILSRYRRFLLWYSKPSLPIVHTGCAQRGLPRSSPKNAAAPLYKHGY